MSNSYKNYSMTNLEKIDLRKKKAERHEWRELQEQYERREWIKQQKLADYLRDKGELDE